MLAIDNGDAFEHAIINKMSDFTKVRILNDTVGD